MENKKNKLVLVVDDDPILRDSLSMILEAYGYDSDTCINGENALTLTKAIKPDIILLDYRMPGIDGIEVIRRLKNNQDMQDLPIIMMTGYNDERARAESLKEGATDFLLKPVDPLELIMRVNNLLQLKEHGKIEAEREILAQTIRQVENAKKEWEHTLDCIDDIIMLVNEDNTIVRLNKTLCLLIDRHYSVIIGRQWEYVLEEYGFQKYSGNAGNVEYLYEGKKWFSCQRYMLGDTLTGSNDGHVIMLKDITALKNAHAAIQESESKFRQLSESAPCAIFMYSDETFFYANPATEEITGYSGDELFSLKFRDIVHRDFLDLAEGVRVSELKGEDIKRRYDFKIIKKDGKERWLDVIFTTITIKDKATGLGVAFDITEQKISKQKLKDQFDFLQTLIDAIPSPIFYKNPDGNFLGCNKAFEAFFGLKKDIIIGKSVYDFTPGHLADQYAAMDMSLLYSQIPQQYEMSVYDAHNVARNVIYNNATYTDANGSLAGMIGIINDITDRKNAERALKDSEEQYRGIYDNAIEGIFRSTPEGKILSVNPATAHMFGFDTPEEMILSVKKLSNLYVDPRDRIAKMNELERKGYVKGFEVKMHRKDGSVFWVLFNSRAVYGEDGSMLYHEGMAENISDRKAAEETAETNRIVLERKNTELQEAYGELQVAQSKILQQEKMASVGQLAAGVAHEINNPIGFIMSNLNSLKKYTERLSQFMHIQLEAVHDLSNGKETIEAVLRRIDEERRSLKIDYIIDDLEHVVGESLEGVDRVRKIVQDLKSFSRIDEEEYKMSNINSGLESTINIVWNELKYKAEVRKEFGNISPTKCNLGQLNQVFMNLLINAAHAIEEHGEITVKTWESKNAIYIAVSDTGSGISEEKINKVFEPFYTTKEVGKGTGLGLSIAYDIVKKHNGEISVKSVVGKGTEFIITIPVIKE
jgi:two-component system NtrC family sensor kinase